MEKFDDEIATLIKTDGTVEQIRGLARFGAYNSEHSQGLGIRRV